MNRMAINLKNSSIIVQADQLQDMAVQIIHLFQFPVHQLAIATINILLSHEWCTDMAVYIIDLFQFAIVTV